MRKKIIETCEMCSIEIPSPITIKVEGALLNVCHKCSAFGNIVKEKTSTRQTSNSKYNKRTSSKSPTISKKGGLSSFSGKNKSDEVELISNFGKVIRSARMKKKLTQEQLSSLTGISVPFIKSIETEKMRPTDKAVKKLERELGIELFITPDVELQYNETKKSKGMTLGDIAVIKRLDYD